MNNLIHELLYSRSDAAMIARTLFEAILAWVAANIGEIFDLFDISANAKTLIMGFVMVIVSTILSYIRAHKENPPA